MELQEARPDAQLTQHSWPSTIMKMSNKTFMEMLVNLTVIASLIFVGMQLLLDRRVAIAEQYFNRAESVKEDRRAALASPQYYQAREERWALGRRPSFWNEDWEIAKQVEEGTLSVASLYSMITRGELAIIGYDNIYFQYQQGLIGEEEWQLFRQGIKRRLKDDPHRELLRAFWLSRSRPAIRPVIEQILQEIDSEN